MNSTLLDPFLLKSEGFCQPHPTEAQCPGSSLCLLPRRLGEQWGHVVHVCTCPCRAHTLSAVPGPVWGCPCLSAGQGVPHCCCVQPGRGWSAALMTMLFLQCSPAGAAQTALLVRSAVAPLHPLQNIPVYNRDCSEIGRFREGTQGSSCCAWV